MPSAVLLHAPRGAAAVLSGVMVASVAVWGAGLPPSQIEATNLQAAAPQVIDMSTSTVQEILANDYQTDRFYLLLLETGTLDEISGAGPYVVYAPDNSAIDYLPRAQYVQLSFDQKKALAEAQLGDVPLPPGVQILKEYQASNGVVYLINQVLPALSTSTPQ